MRRFLFYVEFVLAAVCLAWVIAAAPDRLLTPALCTLGAFCLIRASMSLRAFLEMREKIRELDDLIAKAKEKR